MDVGEVAAVGELAEFFVHRFSVERAPVWEEDCVVGYGQVGVLEDGVGLVVDGDIPALRVTLASAQGSRAAQCQTPWANTNLCSAAVRPASKWRLP